MKLPRSTRESLIIQALLISRRRSRSRLFRISVPVIVIGFAPPYYPPTHSDQVKGKEGFGTKAFEKVRELSEKEYGQKVDFENSLYGNFGPELRLYCPSVRLCKVFG